MLQNKSFCSKILLFGEYSIIKDSMGLAIPYHLFEGRLAFPRDEQSVSKRGVDHELKAFSQYIKQIQKNATKENSFNFDVTSFEFDLSQGLYFDSTIPQGFGVGSSGALCAALYDRYGSSNQELFQNILQMKNIFSQMESHFHGASSGIDPLISFMDTPILIMDMNDIGPVNIPNYEKGDGGIFLLNTGRARRTEPLVNLFLEKCNTKRFSQLCQNVLLPITNGCITSFLEADKDSLYEFYRELSDFQFRHFTPMIPKLFQDIWAEGLKTENFYLKLCGAGGGGFLLGITRDFGLTRELLSHYEIRRLFHF